MLLPECKDLNTASLSGVFRDTTNSYKFYWFLSILDSLQENGEPVIQQDDLALRMLAHVWYPLDYYKLSFGKQDGFKPIAEFITSKLIVDNRVNALNLVQQINSRFSEEESVELSRKVLALVRWVPYRFIRPFFNAETAGMKDYQVNDAIETLSNGLFEKEPHRIMYKISKGAIELNPVWMAYFQKHQGILRGFIYWHLVRFIQKHNPNVIGLSEKLEKPAERKLALATRFWKNFIDQNPGVSCIYSGQQLSSQDSSMDHFLPWSYVAHDQLWNIIPTPRITNASKGNRLPSLDLYFDKFSSLQYRIVQFYLKNDNARFLEDYDQLCKVQLGTLSEAEFSTILRAHLVPHFQTARNLGFNYPYIHPNSKPDERDAQP